MSEKLIIVEPATGRDRTGYGITHRSVGTVRMTGKGIHNPSHAHTLNVWDNTGRPNLHNGQPVRFVGQYGKTEGGNGAYMCPNGRATDSALSLLFSAEATVISAHRSGFERPATPVTLALGDTVTVADTDGNVIGRFTVAAKPLHNPHLEPVI